MNTTVLIPAAGPPPEGVLALSNISSPAMIPVAGRPVIYWTMSYLRDLGLKRFVIAVAERGGFIEDFIACAFGQECEVEFMVPSRDGGVGLTLTELAERAQGDSALVVLGDTHFQLDDPAVLEQGQPFVLTSEVDESYRWCVAESDASGNVTKLRDKDPTVEGPSDALVGVYFFPDLEILQRAGRAAVTAAKNQRTELAAILDRVGGESVIRAIRAGDWLDVGNPDRQASAHQALLQKRDFNELSIDATFGTITKRSQNVRKFIDEINYLRLLPEELSVLFPRLIDYSLDWQAPWMRMEYYGYPSLSEIFVFENVDPGIWERIFMHLLEIIREGFMSMQRPLPANAVTDMYLNKTRERLAAVTGPQPFLDVIAAEGVVQINGRDVANLSARWAALEDDVGRLEDSTVGSVIHGDLCLPNILYDVRSRICKLVDPRGRFGDVGIYGDPRYDVAKLYHSVYGAYDFIVNDLFDVSHEGAKAQLDIRTRPQHTEICRRFEKVFFAEFDRREILLITALQFASMPALHYDSPRRQMAMYLRSLQLLDEYYEQGD